MENELLRKLSDKSLTKEALLLKVRQNFDLLPTILVGVSSSTAAVRAKTLREARGKDQ